MAPGAYRIMAAGTYGGDAMEKACWPLFLQSDFPSYETFWQQKVVRVTTRPTVLTSSRMPNSPRSVVAPKIYASLSSTTRFSGISASPTTTGKSVG